MGNHEFLTRAERYMVSDLKMKKIAGERKSVRKRRPGYFNMPKM